MSPTLAPVDGPNAVEIPSRRLVSYPHETLSLLRRGDPGRGDQVPLLRVVPEPADLEDRPIVSVAAGAQARRHLRRDGGVSRNRSRPRARHLDSRRALFVRHRDPTLPDPHLRDSLRRPVASRFGSGRLIGFRLGCLDLFYFEGGFEVLLVFLSSFL